MKSSNTQIPVVTCVSKLTKNTSSNSKAVVVRICNRQGGIATVQTCQACLSMVQTPDMRLLTMDMCMRDEHEHVHDM